MAKIWLEYGGLDREQWAHWRVMRDGIEIDRYSAPEPHEMNAYGNMSQEAMASQEEVLQELREKYPDDEIWD